MAKRSSTLRATMRALALAAFFAASAAFAEPPSAEQMAKLQNDIQKAQDAVDKKYEGKNLSQDERKQQMQERAAAENGVLEKAGVDRKEFARANAKMSKDDRAAYANEKEKLDKQAKAGAAADKGEGAKEIVIEKGGPGGKPMTDEEEAAAMDRAAGYGKSSGGKRKK
jgi:hypothetical protein